MRWSRIFQIVVLSITLFLLVNGCTVIGFTIGSSIDKNTPESESVPYLKWLEIERGTDIKLINMNGDTTVGKYISADPMSFTQSKNQYRTWYQESGDNLNYPDIDSTITVKTINNSYEGRLYGFDLNTVWVKYTDRHAQDVLPLKDIISISDNHNKKIITGDDIKSKIDNRLLPISISISIQMNKDTLFIAAMHIKDIKIKLSRNAKWWGAIIGLPLDAVLVYSILWLSNWQPWEAH